MGARYNFGKLEIFSKKKCIIYLVELDELFPKIGVRDIKTACGRCGAYAKSRNNAKLWAGPQVTWYVSGFGVSDPDFRKQLVELYKMYNTLFIRKNFKFTKVISSSQI